MRTCEEPRPPNGQSPIALAAGQRSEPQPRGLFLVRSWGVGGRCSRLPTGPSALGFKWLWYCL